MRTSLTGSLFLLVGAGAAAVAAAGNDVNGNNLHLNGSDTLFEVTKEVLSLCPGASSRGIVYDGGGSGVGIVQQQANNQRVSPGSRAMKNTEYCPTGTATNNGAPVSTAANSEALLLGIDGLSIVTNKDVSCSSTTGAANGLGKASFPVSGNPDYTVSSSFDVLNLLYFGLHNGTGGSTANSYGCGSVQRRALVSAWTNLFRTDCSTGDTVCSTGLTHAWRRADVSGTADAFVGILNPPGRGLGTISTVPAAGRSRKTEPFCNSHDANNGTTSYLDEGAPGSLATLTYWSGGDMQDEDPIRINSNANTATSTTGDSVSRGQQAGKNFAGTLGLVLPILPPDAPNIGLADAYPTANCSTSCDLVAIIRTNQIPNGFTCPDGTAPTLGKCYQPVISSANPDPRCIATNSTKCFGAVGNPDGRAYNLATVVLASQLPTANQATGATYQYALDANKRIMSGSFYRIHMRKPAPNAAPNASLGQTGICQQPDATQQIGCLVDADRCSIGFAGREAAQDFPGTGTPINPVAEPLKALAVDAPGGALTPPFTPGANPDLALQNLLAAPGTTPFYPLARRLYLHTMFGFGDAQLFATNPPNADAASGERELVKCFNNASITTVAISDNGYVPHTTSGGGIECLDYPEESASTASPPVNVQGPGNVALPGCGLGGTGHDACTDVATAP
ncbi:MAG TPA: hypothetical protein VHM31_13805 [Polyangia bacterium]|nr:hypothetical protein [Polyangia bacterium]